MKADFQNYLANDTYVYTMREVILPGEVSLTDGPVLRVSFILPFPSFFCFPYCDKWPVEAVATDTDYKRRVRTAEASEGKQAALGRPRPQREGRWERGGGEALHSTGARAH